jgi:hypothetical protein
MCIHIMARNNIRRVYYSTQSSAIESINLSQYYLCNMYLNIAHLSKGADHMIALYIKNKHLRIPLSKQQKQQKIKLILESHT